jgi:hypothetical protein
MPAAADQPNHHYDQQHQTEHAAKAIDAKIAGTFASYGVR